MAFSPQMTPEEMRRLAGVVPDITRPGQGRIPVVSGPPPEDAMTLLGLSTSAQGALAEGEPTPSGRVAPGGTPPPASKDPTLTQRFQGFAKTPEGQQAIQGVGQAGVGLTQSGASSGDIAMGAVGGAMTGAMIGAAFGPIGIAAGALIGGLAGGFAASGGGGGGSDNSAEWAWKEARERVRQSKFRRRLAADLFLTGSQGQGGEAGRRFHRRRRTTGERSV